MTPLQRVGGFMIPSMALNAMVLPVFIISLPLLLLSGQPMITYQTPAQLRLLLRLACVMVISEWNHDLLCSMKIGCRGYLRWLEAATWMSPCACLLILHPIPAIRSFWPSVATHSLSLDYFEPLCCNFLLPVSLGGRKLGFHPSGSCQDSTTERDPTLNISLH